MFYGASGSGKSFVLQDLACSIASGVDWLGRYPLDQGLVCYIMAEGQAGLRQRTAAWLQHHELGAEWLGQFMVVRQPINFLESGDVDDLCRAIETATGNITPSLVIVDTMHRCLCGGDENSAQDVGAFLANVGRLQARYGCSVAVVHHSGHNETRARGSSSLRAAVDAEYRIEKSGSMLTLFCTKAKDSEEPAPIFLRLTGVTLPDGKSSCVIEANDNAHFILSDFEQRIARLSSDNPDGLCFSEYKNEFVPAVMSRGTLATALRNLVQRSILLKSDDKMHPKYYPATTSEGSNTSGSNGTT